MTSSGSSDASRLISTSLRATTPLPFRMRQRWQVNYERYDRFARVKLQWYEPSCQAPKSLGVEEHCFVDAILPSLACIFNINTLRSALHNRCIGFASSI